MMHCARMLLMPLAVCAAVTAEAVGVVFSAGEALRANMAGSPLNPYAVSGGTWSYLEVATSGGAEALATTQHQATRIAGRGFSSAAGVEFAANMGNAPVYLDNNATTYPQPFNADEVYIAPANGRAGVVRFTVAEDGWYSATAEFKGLDNGDAYGYVFVGGADCASGRFSLQIKNCYSKIFCAQITPRYLTAGTAIDFKVVPTGAYAKEMSALRAIVRKEVLGTFYDLGTALIESVTNNFANPLQDSRGGFWEFLYRPDNGRVFKAISKTNSADEKGYLYDDYQQLYVRIAASNAKWENAWEMYHHGDIDVHPKASKWTDGSPVWQIARFFPPKPGYYSGTLALRATSKSASDGANGNIYVGVNRKIATTFYRSTDAGVQSAMSHFGPVYLMAGEPLDFFVDPGPAGKNSCDRGFGSLVIRREDDYQEPGKTVYDANVAMHDNIGADDKPVSNPLVLADGAKWEWGYSTELASAVTPFTSAQAGVVEGNCGYSITTTPYYNQLFVRTENSLWKAYGNVLMHLVPYMFNAHPSMKAKTVFKFTPSRDGRYTIKMRGRALAPCSANDCVNIFTVVNGRALGKISDRQMKYNDRDTYHDQDIPTLEFEAVDLHAGDDVRFVIDPNRSQSSDRCGCSFALIREGDIPAPGTDGVVNFACFTPGDSGKVSGFTGEGKVQSGTMWNAFPACVNATFTRESDGTTKRNARLLLPAVDDVALARGGSPAAASEAALYNGWITATNGEARAFTIGRLVPGNRYTLCLYSARGTDVGNAVFTVGGESKTVNCTVIADLSNLPVYNERLWFGSLSNSYVVFEDVEADANGEIKGEFACQAGADEAAFNGAQIQGEFPPYVPFGSLLIVR